MSSSLRQLGPRFRSIDITRSFRHNSLSRNPDYGQRLFQFDRFTRWPSRPGSLKITYFSRLSWSSLEFPRIGEPIRFSSSHSTLPPDPLHPLKTERNGEWLFSGQVSKLWPDIAFNLDYWNYEISINSFELRKRERKRDSKYTLEE